MNIPTSFCLQNCLLATKPMSFWGNIQALRYDIQFRPLRYTPPGSHLSRQLSGTKQYTMLQILYGHLIKSCVYRHQCGMWSTVLPHYLPTLAILLFAVCATKLIFPRLVSSVVNRRVHDVEKIFICDAMVSSFLFIWLCLCVGVCLTVIPTSCCSHISELCIYIYCADCGFLLVCLYLFTFIFTLYLYLCLCVFRELFSSLFLCLYCVVNIVMDFFARFCECIISPYPASIGCREAGTADA